MTSRELRKALPVTWFSLGLGWRWDVVLGLAGAVCADVAVRASGASMEGPVGALTMLPVMLALFLTPGWVSALVRFLRMRKLSALEVPLDTQQYLRALNTRAQRALLRVTVVFASSTAADLDGAFRGFVETAPGVVTMSSPVMKTVQRGLYYTTGYNGRLHVWFVELCNTRLRLAAASHPIERVSVEVVPDGAVR